MVDIDQIQSSGKDFNPFIKQAELKKGTIAKILSELKESDNPKIRSKYLMDIEVEGVAYTWTPNETSLRGISKIYGNKTINWIGKTITFFGSKPMGAGRGWLWGANE